MKRFVGIVIEGIEDIAAEEVEGQMKEKGRILFDKEKSEYKTIDIVYECDEEFSFETEEDVLNQIEKKKWQIESPFRVTCRREGEHLFKATDVERDIGEIIYEQGYKVDLEPTRTTVFVDFREKK